MTALPRSRPLTREDLDAMPDDGHRYELVDGALVVTPAPSERHETVVGEPYLLLQRACPDHLEVLLAPFDVAPAGTSVGPRRNAPRPPEVEGSRGRGVSVGPSGPVGQLQPLVLPQPSQT